MSPQSGRQVPLSRPAAWLAALALAALAVLPAACGMMDRHRSMMQPVEPRPAVTPAPTATPGGTATVSFREDVRPLLVRNCARCHGGQLGLYVDSYDTLMAGSSRGPVVVPGDAPGSNLVRRLKGEATPRMPLDSGPLTDTEIALVETWIREGAPNN